MSDTNIMASRQAFLKILIGVIFVALLARAFIVDFSQPYYGSDYGSHIAIANTIDQGHLFPELHSNVVSVHSVSKYLPIYHGLIGAHVLALAVSKFGPELPTAFLLLADLSLLVSLIILYLWLRPFLTTFYQFAAFATSLVFVSLIWILHVGGGSYSQVMSVPFALAGLWAFSKKEDYRALGFWIAGTWMYPDMMLWALPLWAFFFLRRSQRTVRHYSLAIFIGFVWAALVSVFLLRFDLPGGINLPDYTVITFCLIWLPLFFFDLKQRRLGTFHWIFFAVLSTCLGAYLYSEIFLNKYAYYAVKTTFWIFMMVPVMGLTMSRYRAGFIFFVTVLMQVFYANPMTFDRLSFVIERPLLTRHFAAVVKEKIKTSECAKPLILPPESNELFEGTVLLMALNSYAGSFDPITEFKQYPNLAEHFREAHRLAYAIKNERQKTILALHQIEGLPKPCLFELVIRDGLLAFK